MKILYFVCTINCACKLTCMCAFACACNRTCLREQRVSEIIYKLVKRVFQYFCFPDRPIKVETSWISRKGGILEKGR